MMLRDEIYFMTFIAVVVAVVDLIAIYFYTRNRP